MALSSLVAFIGAVAGSQPGVIPLRTNGSAGAICTGALVSPREVLTSTACAKRIQAAQAPDAWFGIDFTTGQSVQLVGYRYHRTAPIALIELAADAPVPPLELNQAAILAQTADVVEWTGSQEHGFLALEVLGQDELSINSEGFCGDDDSAVVLIDGRVAGLVRDPPSISSFVCSASTLATRLDAYLADFIWPTIDSREGPCVLDGVCVTSGCRTPDPDCPGNECGMQGICKHDCALPDYDCPIGGTMGDICTDSYDCENRLCEPTVDQPSLKLCTVPCDLGSAFQPCKHGMSCDAGICRFNAPSPHAQGWPCTTNDACHSGMCDRVVASCVEPCAADGSCPGELACRGSQFGVDVCLTPQEARAACAVSPSSDGAATAPWLLLVVLAIARRVRCNIRRG